MIRKIESAQPCQGLRLAVLRLEGLCLVAVGFLEEVRHALYLGFERFFRRDRAPLVFTEFGFVRRCRADAPAEGSVDTAVPSELAELILVPIEWNDEDAAVGYRVQVEESDDRFHHFRFSDAVQDEVFVNPEASHLGVRLLPLRAGTVQVRVVYTMRAKGWQNRKVGFMLKEEAQVA